MNRFLTCALAAVCIAPFAARAEGEAIAVAELVFAMFSRASLKRRERRFPERAHFPLAPRARIWHN